MITNPGGSVDLYVGGTAPQGYEGQWIKTTPREGWFVLFRLYGPGEAMFDGTWELAEFETV